jgi:hypothetical protein
MPSILSRCARSAIAQRLEALAIDFWSLLSRRISDARLFIDGTESPQIAEAIEKV